MTRTKIILQFGERHPFEHSIVGTITRTSYVTGAVMDEFAHLRSENLSELSALNLQQETSSYVDDTRLESYLSELFSDLGQCMTDSSAPDLAG